MILNKVNVDEIYNKYDELDDKRRIRISVSKSSRIRRDPRGKTVK